MTLDGRELEIESQRTYLVFDRNTGVIVHVHRVVTHCGAEQLSDETAHARALELATQFGQRSEKIAVLRADKFDSSVAQRVNLKTSELSVETAARLPRVPGRGHRNNPI